MVEIFKTKLIFQFCMLVFLHALEVKPVVMAVMLEDLLEFINFKKLNSMSFVKMTKKRQRNGIRLFLIQLKNYVLN